MRIAMAAGLGLAAAAAAAVVVLHRQGPPTPTPAFEKAAVPVAQPDEECISPEVLRTPAFDDETVPPSLPPGPRPTETRDARLFIRLVDEETRDPVAMKVRLWRLGVPGDERWTEGDLEVAKFAVTVTGGSVEALVPGRYRLFCEGQREGAGDPPEFSVRSGDNDFVGSLRMARTFKVHLRVFDEDGRPVETATCQTTIATRASQSRSSPSWAVTRSEKLPDGSFRGSGGSFTTARG